MYFNELYLRCLLDDKIIIINNFKATLYRGKFNLPDVVLQQQCNQIKEINFDTINIYEKLTHGWFTCTRNVNNTVNIISEAKPERHVYNLMKTLANVTNLLYTDVYL